MNRIQQLSELFSKFPGIGKKTALRYVYFLLKQPSKLSKNLSTLLEDLHKVVHPCKDCGFLCETELCEICSNPKRNKKQLCVVAHLQDVSALEDCHSFFGIYHILGGLISPLEGLGPDQLNIDTLNTRIKNDAYQEIILATPPTLEGEVTARYIMDMHNDKQNVFTRIAQGMPKGGEFEFTDKYTLSYALEARKQFE